jgi:hypothetical protein
MVPPRALKRPVGRPKGSKNGPDAGKGGRPVGRPRKQAGAGSQVLASAPGNGMYSSLHSAR